MPGELSDLERLNALLAEVSAHNPFQRERLPRERLDSLEELAELPFTDKGELLRDQELNPPFGSNLTYELDRYSLVFQTTGTTGIPLRILETPEDWAWWRRCFGAVLRAAGLGSSDRIALASSFGPYVQFWASHEASQEVGAMTIALGGMGSLQRLETLAAYGATGLICTPTYALHLARRARELGHEGALESVQRIVCTGEPGASVPAVKAEIERLWGARCFDHAGLSEVGSFSYPCATGGGLHLNSDEFLFEVIDPATTEPAAAGEVGELVVTALDRRGFPAIRYRTGDAIQLATERCPAGHEVPWLPGGIIGRTDDMVVIRGMNVFPSAIVQSLRDVGGVGEFLITFYTDPNAMDEVKVEAELEDPDSARQIQAQLRAQLGLRVRIVPLKPGILPTQMGKARRVTDLRRASPPLAGVSREP
jgi:phenylacetate-CoA ligase